MKAQEQRAAELLGQGWTRREVAGELGVHVASISRWRQRQDFKRAEQLAGSQTRGDHEKVRNRLLSIALSTNDDKLSIAAAHELREWLGRPATDGLSAHQSTSVSPDQDVPPAEAFLRIAHDD
jgi:transposase